jgi:GxxExxY protein
MQLQPESTTGIDEEDKRLLGRAMTHRIVGCAMRVHATLGPGLLESAYRAALLRELELAELATLSEVPIGLNYKGVPIDCGFRADLIVERRVILELKSVERILPIHAAQLMTYLKLTRLQVGLIINFGTVHLRHGLKRVVL